jgi:hypothetical protein
VTSPAPVAEGASAQSLRVELQDHLSFGARVEHAAILVDGVTAFEEDAPAASDARVRLPPGVHTLAVVLRASEPCGLFPEPRTTVTAEATTAVRASGGPAHVVVDLYGSQAMGDPLGTLDVHFQGERVELGAHLDAAAVASCPAGDALCRLDALADRARARRELSSVSCYEARRAEIRSLLDVVEDSHTIMDRGGVTNGIAEHAQLRARAAEDRIAALSAAAESTCAPPRRQETAMVERKIEQQCPSPERSGLLERF